MGIAGKDASADDSQTDRLHGGCSFLVWVGGEGINNCQLIIIN